MDFSNSVELPFPKSVVWDGLNDPDILRACIPGCESFDAPQPDHFDVVAVLKIGMIKARFEGEVDLTDVDAPNGYRITGAGKGGVAGYASGQAKVWLEEIESGTRLNYEAKADVGGKIAQLGSRLIDTVANQMADQFFKSFADVLKRQQAGEDISASTDTSAKSSKTSVTASSVAAPTQVTARVGRYDWLLPHFVGLGLGILIGTFATLAFG